jgi:hypothetical protein
MLHKFQGCSTDSDHHTKRADRSVNGPATTYGPIWQFFSEMKQSWRAGVVWPKQGVLLPGARALCITHFAEEIVGWAGPFR